MNVTDMKHWAARTYEDCLQVGVTLLNYFGAEG
jgi:hypothetical protein